MNHMASEPGCRFCLANNLLVDTPWLESDHFFCLGSIDPLSPHGVMIIPRRHSETPFDMNAAEWAGIAEMMAKARERLARHGPDGFTVGWNVGAVGGQSVFHTHMHIIPRFKGEINEGAGLRRVLRPVKLLDADT